MFTCFGCYCMQLATVYCVGRGFGNCTCCYASNLAILVNGNLVVKLNAAICKANAACAFTCADDGFDILQLIVQLYFNISTIMAYADVLVAAEVNSFTGCNLSRGFVTVCRKVPTLVSSFFYSVQLAAVYCFFGICRNFAVCYTGNLATFFNDNIINLNLAAICKANAACAFTCAGDGLNASQLFFQRNANFITIIAYLNVSIAIKFNCSARFYIRCIAILSFQLPTLACASSSFTYLLQLCYVYCVSIFSTCCYIGNLTSNFFTLYRTAYRNSTISCLPSNTGFSFSSTIAKRVGICACYTANAQGNTAFNRYRSTVADSNCITSRNRILMTEGNNIASVTDCVIVAHYNRIGNFT